MPLLQKETFPPLSKKTVKVSKEILSTSYDLSFENFEKHGKKINWQGQFEFYHQETSPLELLFIIGKGVVLIDCQCFRKFKAKISFHYSMNRDII